MDLPIIAECKAEFQNSLLLFLQLGFNDVLAEPDTAQGFDAVWKLAYVVFSQTKCWLYRILAAVVAIPAAIFWGIVFR